jgi:transposase-like protein
MIDWYWLPWKKILIVYYEYRIEKVIWFSICNWETKENIAKDLNILKSFFDYDIKTSTTDWWKWCLKALKIVYPNIIIQRCLVHIQRQVLSYISKNPKLREWKELKHIVSYKILSDSFLFPLLFKIWKKSNLYFLSEKSLNSKWKYSYKHIKIRKAMKHIENALSNMFNSSNNIEISTNKLEWYFWVLTNECINEHKWIREDRLSSLIALWIYFRNEN